MTSTATARTQQRRQAERERRAVEKQRQQRRRHVRILVTAVTAVVAVVAALVVASVVTGKDSGPAAKRTTVSPALVSAVTDVPQETLDAVGAGDAANPPRPVNDAARTVNGKPEVLYIGAEYCPFCALQRWPMIQALSRFGTFSGLSTTRSAADDVHPNTPTFTFHGAKYSSDYLTFTPVELYTNEREGQGYKPLDKATPEQAAVLARYGGSFPLLDIGGRFVQGGASFSPDVVHGLGWTEIGLGMADPKSPIAKGIDGSANVITSYLCQLTNGQPAAVCTAPGVKAAAASANG